VLDQILPMNKLLLLSVISFGLSYWGLAEQVWAQTVPSDLPPVPRELPPVKPLEDPDDLIRKQEQIPFPLPVSPTPTTPTPDRPLPIGNTFRVKRFVVVGSRVFSQAEIDRVTAGLVDRPISFAEVLQARSQITELYVNRGYITTGAYVPEQEFIDGGEVQIAVIEGDLEAIELQGNERLNTSYLRSRIARSAKAPLNREKLLEGLQLLRLNPLLSNLSATLEGGTRPGKSVLTVQVKEAPSFDTQFNLNNNRSPSVGTFRRGMQLSEANLLGFGDSLSIGYNNTDGSNSWDFGYAVPITPQDTTLSFNYGISNSKVIESPFDILKIDSESRYYELSLRHPLQRTTRSELAMGLTFSRRESQTSLGFEDIGPFPLSPGADDQGRTRVSALRFFQELTKRSDKQVLAFRSQFSLGVNAFDATQNPGNEPDSQFFTWRGQGQWVRLIGNDSESLLLVRGEIQLSDRPLLSVEQFGLGGIDTVRGYRQDALLTDSGLFGSVEARFPIARMPNWNSTVSLTPFLEFGHGWNRGRNNPENSTLLAAGLGLRWRVGNQFTARLDWGIPLIALKKSDDPTLQENGIYFTVLWNPF
jgi:hemolysin activation/secretion protein